MERGSKRVFFLLLLLTGLTFSCEHLFSRNGSSLDQIRERGSIVLITQNSGNTYYLYREEPMGFEYDLAMEFARYLGVDLEVSTPGWLEMFDMLDRGKGDFIAAGVTVVPSREERVQFSDPYLVVRQRLILHHDEPQIRSLEELDGKTLYVRAGTSYEERLSELQEQGIGLNLALVPDVPTEELIRQVADKEIQFTVADSNIAHLNRRFYPDIRIGLPLSDPQVLAWAVQKGNEELLKAINDFMTTIRTDGTFKRIYNRYHEDRDILARLDLKVFHRRVETRLPDYQPIIQEAADNYGFDWRFIAAMMYQESHFNPRARSYTGVKGLMQLTRTTAMEMGITNRMDPVQSIEGGVKYLAILYDWFDDIESEPDRLLFALASYNVGYGHVRDAQEIARERGRDPDSWASVLETLPLLRMPEFYRDTRFGYARGTEAVRYVGNVLAYYDILKNKI